MILSSTRKEFRPPQLFQTMFVLLVVAVSMILSGFAETGAGVDLWTMSPMGVARPEVLALLTRWLATVEGEDLGRFDRSGTRRQGPTSVQACDKLEKGAKEHDGGADNCAGNGSCSTGGSLASPLGEGAGARAAGEDPGGVEPRRGDVGEETKLSLVCKRRRGQGPTSTWRTSDSGWWSSWKESTPMHKGIRIGRTRTRTIAQNCAR